MRDDDAPEVQQYVYRCSAVELAPGRYSLDAWVREPWFDRGKPNRATEGKLWAKGGLPLKKGSGAPPKLQLTPASCPEYRQRYRMVETIPNKVGRGFTVRARCTGAHCDGRERVFSMYQWCDEGRPISGCNRCTTVARVEARRAKRAALRSSGQAVYVTVDRRRRSA